MKRTAKLDGQTVDLDTGDPADTPYDWCLHCSQPIKYLWDRWRHAHQGNFEMLTCHWVDVQHLPITGHLWQAEPSGVNPITGLPVEEES